MTKRTTTMLLSFIFVCSLWLDPSQGFVVKKSPAKSPSSATTSSFLTISRKSSFPSSTTTTTTTTLFGINEWRDTEFEVTDTSPLGKNYDGIPREICLLPFPFTEVLLQGETKQLRLYEERFIKLFETVMEKHSGVVAMGLIAESGIIQTVPLCEIEAYNRMEGFGIFVTIRVVGRAQLVQVQQQEPFLMGYCIELNDKIPPNLELPNLLSSSIENFMVSLSSMEHELAAAMEENSGKNDNGDDDDETSAEMRRRIQVAKLDDKFYDDDEDEDEDDEDEDKDDTYLDRRGRFGKAYNVALSTDTQGYCVNGSVGLERTPQELTALSWAAFCTDLFPEEDAAYRIQALDCEDLFERLKLASHMLKEKKNKLKQQMKKAGINYKGGEFDEEL